MLDSLRTRGQVEAPAAEKDTLSSTKTMTSTSFSPIVIPQTSRVFEGVYFSPFARAYPPSLADMPNPVTKEEFANFIDDLNEAFLASPVLRSLVVAGTVVSCAPEVITMAAASSISFAAWLGSYAVSYHRTKAFVKAANEKLWAPRGLQMRLLSTKNLLEALDIDSADFKLPTLPQQVEPDKYIEPAEDPRLRWLEALNGQVAQLDWSMPEVAAKRNWMKRWGTWQAKRLYAKRTKKLLKNRSKAQGKYQKARSSSTVDAEAAIEARKHLQEEIDVARTEADRTIELKGLPLDGVEAAKIQEEVKCRLQALETELDSIMETVDGEEQLERDMGEKAFRKVNKKEGKIVQKIRWLVIEPLKETSEGLELVDTGIEDGA